MKKLQRVVFYIRVSTDEQKLHGISLDAQKSKLEEYAKKHNLIISGYYIDEGVSGRKPIKKRPQLQQMLKDAGKDMFDLIIFIKLDRYFRSVAEYHECQKILDDHGIKWSATEEKYDLTTANGRAFLNMKLTIAELEADQTGERILLVNEYKVKEGYALSGSQPFGWTTKRDGKFSRVVIDKEVSHIVYELLDHFELHQTIVASIHHIQDKYNLSPTYKVLRNTISSPLLYGYYRGNANYCEPYISKARYDKIQNIIEAKNIRHSPNNVYLFSGLIFCGNCGTLMVGQANKRPEGIYYNYRCNSLITKASCSRRLSKSENKIERYLLAHLKEALKDYIIKAEIKETRSTPKKVNVDAIHEELDRLNYQFQKKRITVEHYDKEYDLLQAKLDKANSANDEIKERDLEPLKKLLNADIEAMYSVLDREHKRAFWHQIIDKIMVYEGDIIEFTVKADLLE